MTLAQRLLRYAPMEPTNEAGKRPDCGSTWRLGKAVLLLVGVVVAIGAIVATGFQVWRTKKFLVTPAAPDAMVSLELARSDKEADRIRQEWKDDCVPPANDVDIAKRWREFCEAGTSEEATRLAKQWKQEKSCFSRSAAEASKLIGKWERLRLAYEAAKARRCCGLECAPCDSAKPGCWACLTCADGAARPMDPVVVAKRIGDKWQRFCRKRAPGAEARSTKEREAFTPSTGCEEFQGSDRPNRLAYADCNLHRDDWFILTYTGSLVFLALVFLAAASAPTWLRVVVVVAAILGGACDWAENQFLRHFLELPALPSAVWDLRWVAEHGALWTRLLAQTKFGLVLVAAVITLTAGAAALRRWWHRIEGDSKVRDHFEDLARKESKSILDLRDRPAGSAVDPEVMNFACGPSAEPWVSFRSRDVVGLALSGGGIRSATFNLGLLTGLSKLDLLSRVDYLSTVSGGGYLGSFWTAWLRRQEPVPPATGSRQVLWPNGNGLETGPVRHLREFSRFLAARWGFFEVEMWRAIVAVLAGLLPAFAAAVSAIGLGLVVWLGTTFFMACPDPWAGVFAVLALTSYVLRQFERAWEDGDPVDETDKPASRRINTVAAVAALILTGVLEFFVVHPWERSTWSVLGGKWVTSPPLTRSYQDWWKLAGIERMDGHAWFLSPRLFDLAAVWFIAGGILLVLRAPFAVLGRREERDRVWTPAYDRVVMRLLGSGVGWAAIAALWHVSVNFLTLTKSMAAASLLSATAFATLRNWIGMTLRAGPQGGTLDRLKPVLPQLLAYLTVALLVTGVGSFEIAVGGKSWMAWFSLVSGMALVVGTMLLFDPGEIGLHAFYRDRIVRAYSGASNPDAEECDPEKNRQTDRRKHDDLALGDLPRRPLHLVCCAANDLSGDPIETLGRGARSAVLSHHGIAMADGWAPPPSRVTLGGAGTASAAAFNSNMGSVSMRVGPVVSFLMAALNLRLGLWVPNPRTGQRKRLRLLPGILFFREMFAQTIADTTATEIHLSDGGHFENLALYELVRRHCRYIVVSDCGADPTIAFDDFGNAARRIREDFGVDIDINLDAITPSRKADEGRRSRQHAVVGTIHYSAFDKGVIIYVKPMLTGDEPPDIQQYATANTQFPHESTADQFYDEAQWESYRALGEHTARKVFGFTDRYGEGVPPADWIFTAARQVWYPTPSYLPDRILKMTDRFGSMEAELQKEKAATMLGEVFPELAILSDADDEGSNADGDAANLTCLLRALQLMEDVWTSCELDEFWNHPLNLGWVNCFARWTAADTFRAWWPLLCPMYSPGFTRFMEERFPTLSPADPRGKDARDDKTPARRLREKPGTVTRWHGPAPKKKLAEAWWTKDDVGPLELDVSGTHDRPNRGPNLGYQYEIPLPRLHQERTMPVHIQVGLLLVHYVKDDSGHWMWWTSDDFYVPPSLWGAGIGGTFLHKFLELRKTPLADEPTVSKLVVFVKAPRDQRKDPGSWADRVSFVEFYKAHGFQIVSPEIDNPLDGSGARAVRLELVLKPASAAPKHGG